MTDYTKLVDALRRCDMKQGCFNANCRYSVGKYFCDMDKVHKDAAAAIESLNRLLDQNTQRCEALRKQLREAHESYERHLNDLEAQLPKQGKWISDRIVTTIGGTYGVRMCSVCEAYYQDVGYGWDYCPNCGAKMEDVNE